MSIAFGVEIFVITKEYESIQYSRIQDIKAKAFVK